MNYLNTLKKTVVRKETDHSYKNKIRYNVLFESVDEDIITALLEKLEELTFSSGTVIFADESSGDSLYLLLSGTVKVVKNTKGGEEASLGILHAGDFFGELELIDNRSRSAGTVAMSDCKLCRIERDVFEDLLKKSPQFARNLLKVMSLRLRSSNVWFSQQLQFGLEASRNQIDKMHKLIEAAKAVNSSLDTDTLLEIILRTATAAVSADRGTLYLIDEAKQELWSKAHHGSDMIEVRLPMGKNIAGFVAATGETINISDAYADLRFNPESDKLNGYKTKTILCMPMKNKDGKIIGVFQLINKAQRTFTFEDEEYLATFSVHAAMAIENAQLAEQMIQNERLSAVGSVASSIIHDIKNPMGTLRVYAQVMKNKSNNEETARLADEMIRQVDRFVTMTQEILDFSRGATTMNVQEVNFGELVNLMLQFIEKDFSTKNIQLVTNLTFKGSITADQEKLARVFYNIAGNAIDAMPNGGTLTVNSRRADSSVVIEFIDTGIGIPEEIKNKIFQPFFTQGKKHGTGLGMAIVKKIVDDHKGGIEVESAKGKGTIIRITLPA
jgi:K+-sensing histidine kinase KdpD